MIIKNIIVGEDIRQEIGNKLSLMGILGEAINIDLPHDAPKDIPVPIILASLITIENDRANVPNDFAMLVTMSLGESQIAKMEARVGANGSPRILHIPVPKFEFSLTESAALTIKAQITKDNEVISENSYILNVTINRAQA